MAKQNYKRVYLLYPIACPFASAAGQDKRRGGSAGNRPSLSVYSSSGTTISRIVKSRPVSTVFSKLPQFGQ